MKILDKVAEAYYGQMGDCFARKTRERIHWICSKVQGTYILDVGCSQGITEILLAREGKQVVGIDIEEEAIAYAKDAIKNESETVKRNVDYQACSIFDFESKAPFDTVILAEVMEHFSSSTALLEKVKNLLTDVGTLIATVPFGINDFIDHKKTYYLFNLLEEIEPYFIVTEVKFFGKWIGVVAKKENGTNERNGFFSRELLRQLEEGFYEIERSLVDDVQIKTNQLKNLHTQIAELRSSVERLKRENEQLKSESQKKELRLNQLNAEQQEIVKSQELRFANRSVEQQEFEKCKQKIGELEQIIELKNKEILERLDSEESTLKKYKNAIFEYSQLEAKYANISKKYELLRNAKLARLTLQYWKLRKRIPEDF